MVQNILTSMAYFTVTVWGVIACILALVALTHIAAVLLAQFRKRPKAG